MTPSEIKPTTFWLVARCLSQMHHHVPLSTEIQLSNVHTGRQRLFSYKMLSQQINIICWHISQVLFSFSHYNAEFMPVLHTTVYDSIQLHVMSGQRLSTAGIANKLTHQTVGSLGQHSMVILMWCGPCVSGCGHVGHSAVRCHLTQPQRWWPHPSHHP